MSRHKKIEYISPTKETRVIIRWIYQSWNDALEKLGRTGTWMPVTLRSDTQRIERRSLAGEVCAWVDELGAEAATETWSKLLEKVPENNFIKNGYRNANAPNLAWMFVDTGKGRGITKVLDGVYDLWTGSGWFSADEGV